MRSVTKGSVLTGDSPPAKTSPPFHPPQIVTILVILIVAGSVGFLHFSRSFRPGRPSPDGMDVIQSARILARTRRFSTNIVRPLLTQRFAVNGDATAPNFADAPLYPVLLAAVLRLTHQTGPGQGDRQATSLSLSLFALSIAGCFLLSRRLFSERGAPLTCLLYGLGTAGFSRALEPHPVFLAALLFTFLLYVLWSLDTVPSAGDRPRVAGVGALVGAGALYGLLYLSLYSALLLLPPLVLYLWHITPRPHRARTLLIFLFTALVVVSPLLMRNLRLAHNPFYNARLTELVMFTDTYPGRSLFRLSVVPRSLSQYLIHGGVLEIGRKAATNLMGFTGQATVVLGFLVLPLFVMAALTRFTDGRVNRMRNMVYICMVCHVAGLCFFAPASESALLLLMYAPFAAALSAAFLISLVRARRMPEFLGRAAVAGWTALACLPGAAQILGGSLPGSPEPYGIFAHLLGSPELNAARAGSVYLLSEVPWEVAYWLDTPVVWLPGDSADMKAVEDRTGKKIAGIVLTPALPYQYRADPGAALWVQTYESITQLSRVVAGLDAKLRGPVVESTRQFYPSQISAGMKGFIPLPLFPEEKGTAYSLVFWKPDALSAGKPDRKTSR